MKKAKVPEGVSHKRLLSDVTLIAWPSFVELVLTQLTSMADQIMVVRLPGEEGVMALAESDRGGSRWFAIVLGILSILAGIVVLFLPLESLAVLVIYGGIFLVVLGAIQIVRAFAFGRGRPRTA